MNEPIAIESISPDALGAAPQVTPGVALITGPVAPDSVHGDASTLPDLDGFKVAFDPVRHVRKLVRVPGGMRWALKRGNGALQAAGRPLTGIAAGKKRGRPAKIKAPEPRMDPPIISQIGPDIPAPKVEPEAAIHVPEVLPPTSMNSSDYRNAGETATGTMFGILRMLFGPAWEPDASERGAWRDCFARLWEHYHWPRMTPIIEMLTLGVMTAEKRASDEPTKAKWKKWFGFTWGKAKPSPATVEPAENKPGKEKSDPSAASVGRGDSFGAIGRAT